MIEPTHPLSTMVAREGDMAAHAARAITFRDGLIVEDAPVRNRARARA